jgi:hypothetical protein
MSEDGMLDILQITVQLEAAASEAWKPMIRETILSCNDVISASKSQLHPVLFLFYHQNPLCYLAEISDENTKILHTLSGQNCSVLPWVMLKCLKKAFFMVGDPHIRRSVFKTIRLQACPDGEVIKRGKFFFLQRDVAHIFCFAPMQHIFSFYLQCSESILDFIAVA